MLRKLVDDPRFAFAELILVLICGAIGIIKPELAFWFLPIALVPWLFRSLAGKPPFQRTVFDWPLLVFLITAGVGGFVAYDKVAAVDKFFFILIAIRLYYAVCSQPQKNFAAVAVLFFVIGIGIALYHFLTRNVLNNPTGISAISGLRIWLTDIRPEIAWLPIPTGHVPGLTVMTTSFVFYGLIKSKKTSGQFWKFMVVVCLVLVLLAILSAQSTSVWVAFFGAAGMWVLWQLFSRSGLEKSHLFPWLVLSYLIPLVVFVCTSDAAASASPSDFGTNSRPEVFMRASYFLMDFPISGGGLASFPGLYSEYMLGIPYFYFSNSYNMFLDVAIEQGLLGGCVLLFIYLGSILQLSGKLYKPETSVQRGLALSVLIFSFIHALMQDYLYNAAGTVLLFFPVAMSVMLGRDPGARVARAAPILQMPSNGRILVVTALVVSVSVGVLLNLNKLESHWYSNLGAVQLAQVQLANFPESGWPGIGIIPRLHDAETSLQTSLRLDPENRTANHRLGIIYMLYRDFESASRYLETAYLEAPNHRGLKKSLGYSYLWMGEIDQAQLLLAEIPELDTELDAYYWWWNDQDRVDLSNKAYLLLSSLHSAQGQP